MSRSVLVVFGDSLPTTAGFDAVVAPRALKGRIPHNVEYRALEDLLVPGSVVEATELLRKLHTIKTPDGEKVSTLVRHKGYALWWARYDDFMFRFCVPYTQYKDLLAYCSTFDRVHMVRPPEQTLFRYYLEAHSARVSYGGVRPIYLPSLSVFLQSLVSIPSIVYLAIRRPRLMVWTSDRFDPPGDFDFRMRDIYGELRRRNIAFVEYIRSMESLPVVIQHFFARRRAVVYSFAICGVIRSFAGICIRKSARKLDTERRSFNSPEERFWFAVATHYLRNSTGDIWSIRVLMWILRITGVKAAIITASTSRDFPEVIACKLLNIPVIGILQGASSKNYVAYDFLHDFDEEKKVSVDRFGVWSQWWREYYIKHSKAYHPEQLIVSGPMRPSERRMATPHTGPLRVLFIAEQLAAPTEVLPYLEALLSMSTIELFIKFRSYNDGFENWLRLNRPDLLARFENAHQLRGTIQEAVSVCDVTVGSHSTAVLESLLEDKPFIFFHTNKWGDYFDIKAEGHTELFADTPSELKVRIQDIPHVPHEMIRRLCEQFFGDPYKNGSAWAVTEASKYI